MNAELKTQNFCPDSGIVPFAQTENSNPPEYAKTTRVIVFDLDGTLLTLKRPAFIDRSPPALATGYQLIIVTGRHHVAIHPLSGAGAGYTCYLLNGTLFV